MFDINHSIIEYDLKIIEQIDAGFLFDSYDVDVYSDEIDLKDVFYVKNRDTHEYEILEEKSVNKSRKSIKDLMDIKPEERIRRQYKK